MNTFTKKVYKGQPFFVKATTAKFYDYYLSTVIYEDTVSNVTLVPYNGITVSFSYPLVLINAGILPNGSEYNGSVGYFGNYGDLYLYDGTIYKGVISSYDVVNVSTDNIHGTMKASLMYNYTSGDVNFIDGDVLSDYVFLWQGELGNMGFFNNANRCNFTISGNPSFDGHLVAFSKTGTYLTADKKFFAVSYGSSDVGTSISGYECIVKVTTPDSLSSYKQIVRSVGSNRYFGTYGTSWCLYDGASRYVGGTVETSKTYWVKVVQSYDTGYISTLYTLDDDGYSLSSLPADGWTEQISMNQDVFVGGETFTIGTSSSYYWRGTIDLDNFILKYLVNGEYQTYWKPLGDYS